MGVFQRGKSFYIDFYRGSKRIRESVGSAKGQAIKALSIRKSEIAQGKFHLVSKSSNLLLGELADRYIELVSFAKRGCRNELYIIQRLKQFIGTRRISDLTGDDGERFKAVRSREVKPATVNRQLTILKHMLTKAVEWELLSRNPLQAVRYLRVPKHIERVLEPDEEILLIAACDRVHSRFLKPVVLMALNTGLRRGEILSLQWPQVDLARRTIRVVNTKSASGDRSISYECDSA
jgi:integrase